MLLNASLVIELCCPCETLCVCDCYRFKSSSIVYVIQQQQLAISERHTTMDNQQI